jgi:hypothetical protein
MNPEEIRKLLGGYATGTLTESERKALFAAALDDQELFDELGREQALKELLDSPEARTRLAAALAPPKKATAWWMTPLPWALTATLAVALVVVFVLAHTSQPKQMVAVAPSPELRASVDQPSKTAGSEPSVAPAASPKPATLPKQAVAQSQGGLQSPAAPEDSERRDGDRRYRPAGAVPAPPPVAALKKEESNKADAVAAEPVDKLSREKLSRDEKDSSLSVQAPGQAPTQAAQQAPSGITRQQLGATNGAVSGAPASPFVPPPAAARAARAVGGRLAPTRVAFDYTLQRDSVSVSPLATGFLAVTAVSTNGQRLVVQPASRSVAGTTVTIAIPSGLATVTLDFFEAPTRAPVNSLGTTTESVTVTAAAPLLDTVTVKEAPVAKQKNGRVDAPAAGSDSHATITLAVPKE